MVAVFGITAKFGTGPGENDLFCALVTHIVSDCGKTSQEVAGENHPPLR
jgi:hypothetical protein